MCKKIILALLFLFYLSSCSITKINQSEAIKLVEGLLNDLKNENYESVDRYFSSSFNESEPLDKKKEKYNHLKEVMGPMQSYELLSAKEQYDNDKGINQLQLIYKVKCKKVLVKETFLVVSDEGSLKIIFQNIENFKEN